MATAAALQGLLLSIQRSAAKFESFSLPEDGEVGAIPGGVGRPWLETSYREHNSLISWAMILGNINPMSDNQPDSKLATLCATLSNVQQSILIQSCCTLCAGVTIPDGKNSDYPSLDFRRTVHAMVSVSVRITSCYKKECS